MANKWPGDDGFSEQNQPPWNDTQGAYSKFQQPTQQDFFTQSWNQPKPPPQRYPAQRQESGGGAIHGLKNAIIILILVIVLMLVLAFGVALVWGLFQGFSDLPTEP